MRSHRWRDASRKLLLSAGTLAFSFVLLEVAVRIHEASSRPAADEEIWAVYDPTLGYRLNPRYPRHSDDGLHDHPVTESSCPRLLMLGDSVGYYGADPDDTWVGRMRQVLAADPATRLDVVNASVKGYTTYQEVEYLERYGLAFEPDVVGVGFVLNDVHHILHAFEVEDGRIVGQTYDFTHEAVNTVQNPLYQLLRKSAFLVWLRRSLSQFDSVISGSVAHGYAFEHRPDFNTAWSDGDEWRDVEHQLERLARLGREHGFRPFVVTFPFGDQYREDYLARDRAYVLSPQRRIAEVCARLSIPHLDLYPYLRAQDHLMEDGIHLLAAGRQRVADTVAAFIAAEDLAADGAGCDRPQRAALTSEAVRAARAR